MLIKNITNTIALFNEPEKCIQNFEKQTFSRKFSSYIKSWGNFITFVYEKKISSLFSSKVTEVRPYTLVKSQGFKCSQLVICLHGLNDSPSQFKKIVAEIQSNYDISNIDIYIPVLAEKGRAPLTEIVKPIFEVIKNSQAEKLHFVGISNGGRAIAALIGEIINSQDLPKLKTINAQLIVPAYKGSWMVNLAHKLHLGWILPKHIAIEMPTGSLRNQQVSSKYTTKLAKQSKIDISYSFYASPHDRQVRGYETSLARPYGKAYQTTYAIIPNHGHISIVNSQELTKLIAKQIFTSTA